MRYSVKDAVEAIRAQPISKRTAAVNDLLAGEPRDNGVRSWRAHFITALREAAVWPQGCS